MVAEFLPFRWFSLALNRDSTMVPVASSKFPAARAQHDRLAGLVDKMLALTPRLRAATTDGERQTLQNAVTATDQQIDALVYELYGLTPEEIALVEGTPLDKGHQKQ
jgi:hypothetical protein